MSLALLRDGPLSARRNDREATGRRVSSRLRALNAVTTAVTQHVGLPLNLYTDFDQDCAPSSLSADEVRILDDNDLAKGRYFHEAIVPYIPKAIPRHGASSAPRDAARPDATPPTGRSTAEVQGPQPQTAVTSPLQFNMASVAASSAGTHLSPSGHTEGARSLDKKLLADTSLVGSMALVDATDLEPHSASDRPAQMANTSPQEVEDESVAEQQRSREGAQRQDQKQGEQGSGVGLGLHMEPPSSPSSTVGAWSTTTPMPGDPSPGTSADDDTVPMHEGERTTASPLSQRAAQEHHDSLLSAKKDHARREARGTDFDLPDTQLRLEQEQAMKATRDAHGPTALSSVGQNATNDATDFSAATVNENDRKPLSSSAQDALEKHSDFNTTVALQGSLVIYDEKVAPEKSSTVLESSKSGKPASNDVASVLPEPSSPAMPSAGPERMRTRVSSGALRHKSVSEIIQGSTKNLPYGVPKTTQDPTSSLTKTGTTIARDRSRAGTTFDGPPKVTRQSATHVDPTPSKRLEELSLFSGGYAALKGAALDANRDYLEPLYRIQAQDPPNGRSLTELLHKASKAVSTSDQLASVHEKQDFRILKRIYGQQYANHWSLRQMEPCAEPPVPKTHMDFLLQEMKWMHTDFRKERKIKLALAKYLAELCAEWFGADEDTRRSLQVTVKSMSVISDADILHSPAETAGDSAGLLSEEAFSPPDLEPSNADRDENSPEETDIPKTPVYATVPGSMFHAANFTASSAHLWESGPFLKAINDLPLCRPFKDDNSADSPMGRHPKPQAAPAVSKYCEGKLVAKMANPPKKRSRFDYEDDDSDTVVREPKSKLPRASQEGFGLAPEQTDVALFDPENKSIRDRLHANTAFRPPSEFPMPSTQFYEFRLSSQWTLDDQQKLRRLAKEYSFNWSLIADEMSLPSRLNSAGERRTPWECFEHWVDLEQLPNEMRKTIYFKTWGQRLEAASRNVDARYQAQLHHHSQTPTQSQPPQKRRTQPIRVEKRRQNRYLHVVDAMRKLARKREQQAHKQVEAQKAASLRKQHENAAPKSNMHTPQEFSRMRHERDVQIAARQERYREQMLAQQKASQMQRSGQFPNQQQALANSAAQQRPSGANVAQVQAPQLQHAAHAQQGANSQIQPHGQQQGVPLATRNGHLAVPQMGQGMQGNIPQAQMQANMRGGAGVANHATSDNLQRMALQTQFKNPQMQNQQYQNHLSPGTHGPNGINGNQAATHPAMMAAMQAAANNTNGGNAINGASMHQQNHSGHLGNSSHASLSPSMPPPPTPSSLPQQLSSGHVPAINHIKHSLQAQHPSATAAQIDQMASEHMRKQLQAAQARQNALNAASGSHNPIATNAYPQQNPSSYQQQQQQQQQQQISSVPNNQVQQQQHANYNAQAAAAAAAAANFNNPTASSPQQAQYSALMRQRLMQQQAQMQAQGGPGVGSANSSSPRTHAPQLSQGQQPSPSPNMTHVSPNMAHVAPNGVNGMGVGGAGGMGMNVQQQQSQQQQSRSATPQMARIPSGGQGQALASPGMVPQHGSPRAAVPTGMARQ